MPAVNWDKPSTGLVSDAAAALQLENDRGGALEAASSGVAIDAVSKGAEAIRARTSATLAASIVSREAIGAWCHAPLATGLVGTNESEAVAIVGLNLASPDKPLDSVNGVGVAGISDRIRGVGVMGATRGPGATGVWGSAQGGGIGVRGSAADGGVEGFASQGHGVAGFTRSERAAGVFGFSPGTSTVGAGVAGQGVAGAGVDGRSNAGPGVRGVSLQAVGVVGESTGHNAAGVFGRNDLASGIGVEAFSQDGLAVRAITNRGIAVDVHAVSGIGVNVSTFGGSLPAVKAYSSSSSAVDGGSLLSAGVRGVSAGRPGIIGATIGSLKAGDPEAGCGVFGNSISGAGTCGITLNGTGVLGIGRPELGAWAGRFQGNVRIDGALYKSASLFSIDHPLDPKRKVLNHACIESPEYKTFYDGVATLDARGDATVHLPRWFDALNHELRYQLTALGGAAPELHIAREFGHGSFDIGGGSPGLRVSWQVTGVRRDTWAVENPLEVEQARKRVVAAVPPATADDVQRLAEALSAAVDAMRVDEAARRTAEHARAPRDLPPDALAGPDGPAEDPVAAVLERVLSDVGRLKPG